MYVLLYASDITLFVGLTHIYLHYKEREFLVLDTLGAFPLGFEAMTNT